MKKLPFLLVLAALVVTAHGAAGAGVERFDIPILDSPSRGPADAPLTVVEFLDFQ